VRWRKLGDREENFYNSLSDLSSTVMYTRASIRRRDERRARRSRRRHHDA